jgi:hypothetical protein
MSKSPASPLHDVRRAYARRTALLCGVVCLWIACVAGCSHSSGGGPEVLPKKYPGAGAPAGNTKGASTAPPTQP